MRIDFGHFSGLLVALILVVALPTGPSLGVELVGVPAQPGRLHHKHHLSAQNVAPPQEGLVAAPARVQIARNQAGPRQEQTQGPGQMQLGGKCPSKGSCAREFTSRKLDLDSGADKRACQCDQVCANYDDCCQDSPWAEPIEVRSRMGLGRLRERRHEWQCRRINPVFGDVLLRASCGAHWLASQKNKTSAELTRRQCESTDQAQGQQSDPMGSLMPITDLASGVTYANSHCLRCNPPPVGSTKKRKLIYWSPLVSCNYNLDLDDRNTLFDLISSKKGQALKYSRRRNKWLVDMPSNSGANSTQAVPNQNPNQNSNQANSTTASATADPDGEPANQQRVCSISPTIPDSVEHFIRHCRARMIDSCPPSQSQQGQQAAGPGSNQTESEELRRARFECHFGHQSLVYSQTSDLVYFNLACARCNHERQVFCEPRLRKQMGGPVSRITNMPPAGGGPTRPGGAANFPPDPLGGVAGNGPTDNQMESEFEAEAARSGGEVRPGGSGEGSFAVLIDVYGGDTEGQVGSVHHCEDAEQQVYDPILLTCRDIVCGLNLRFVDGACVQVEEPSSNLATAATNSTLGGQLDQVQATPAGERVAPPMQPQDNQDRRPDKLERPPASSSGSSESGQSKQEAAQRLVGGSGAPEVGQKPAALLGSPGANSNSTAGQQEEDEEEKHNSFVELLASLQLDELPKPTSESRRVFAECAKILVQPEHYRLFTLADLNSTGSSLNSSSSPAANSESPAGLPDVRFLSAGEHQKRARSLDWEQKRHSTWALVAPYNLTLASSQFELVHGLRAGELNGSAPSQVLKLLVCSPFKSDLVSKFKPTMVYLTTCCLAISITSLVLFLVLYGLSTFDLRHLVVELAQAGQVNESLRGEALDSKFRGSRASNDTSYNATRSQSLSARGVACLAGALLLAYLLFILGHQDQSGQDQQAGQAGAGSQPGGLLGLPNLTSCTLVAAATYCSFLMAFNWMFLLSYDIWRTLRLATCQLRTPTMSSQSARFVAYAVCAAGAALAVTALALAIDQAEPVACSSSTLGHEQTSAQTGTANSCTSQSTLERFIATYRPKFGRRAGSCWFSNRRSLALFFGLPVTLIMFVNLLFFLHSSFMVIKTSSRSSRRMAGASGASSSCSSSSSSSSTNSQSSLMGQTASLQDCGGGGEPARADQMLDFTQTNGMTTSSISSVQTIQSNLSLASESDFGGTNSPAGGASASRQNSSASSSGTSTPPGERKRQQQQAAAQIQIQIDKIDEASRRLNEATCQRATARNSFRDCKQASSSSLLSANSNSNSLASNLAQRYDLHLTNLSSLMSSIVKDYRLYCRLSTIMGLTWLTGLMASVVDQSELLWYLFVVLNTLQGLFIFVAFGFKRSRLTNAQILFDYFRFRLARACSGRARPNSPAASPKSDLRKDGSESRRAGDF